MENKKYRLKKDLPRAKAGTIVELTQDRRWRIRNPNIFKINCVWETDCDRHRLGFINKNELEDWLEELPELEKSVFNLEMWEKFYYLKSDWKIAELENTGCWENGAMMWNIFLTKEEAEKEREKRLAIGRVKKFMWENWIKTEIFGWVIDYDNCKRIFIPECFTKGYFSPFWELEKKDCQKIIDNCENDLKIIFWVK